MNSSLLPCSRNLEVSAPQLSYWGLVSPFTSAASCTVELLGHVTQGEGHILCCSLKHRGLQSPLWLCVLKIGSLLSDPINGQSYIPMCWFVLVEVPLPAQQLLFEATFCFALVLCHLPLSICVYHSERLEIKISNRERHIRQSPGDNRHEFLVVLLQWSSIDTTASLSNSVWQHSQLGKLTQVLVSKIFTGVGHLSLADC